MIPAHKLYWPTLNVYRYTPKLLDLLVTLSISQPFMMLVYTIYRTSVHMKVQLKNRLHRKLNNYYHNTLRSISDELFIFNGCLERYFVSMEFWIYCNFVLLSWLAVNGRGLTYTCYLGILKQSYNCFALNKKNRWKLCIQWNILMNFSFISYTFFIYFELNRNYFLLSILTWSTTVCSNIVMLNLIFV